VCVGAICYGVAKELAEQASRVLCFTDCFLLLAGLLFIPEEGGSKFLQNGEFQADYIVSQPRGNSILPLYGLFQFLF
jgi:hypothetical protein